VNREYKKGDAMRSSSDEFPTGRDQPPGLRDGSPATFQAAIEIRPRRTGVGRRFARIRRIPDHDSACSTSIGGKNVFAHERQIDLSKQ
jgi:hypothetical protein